jgi:hypothetical protein
VNPLPYICARLLLLPERQTLAQKRSRSPSARALPTELSLPGSFAGSALAARHLVGKNRIISARLAGIDTQRLPFVQSVYSRSVGIFLS